MIPGAAPFSTEPIGSVNTLSGLWLGQLGALRARVLRLAARLEAFIRTPGEDLPHA